MLSKDLYFFLFNLFNCVYSTLNSSVSPTNNLIKQDIAFVYPKCFILGWGPVAYDWFYAFRVSLMSAVRDENGQTGLKNKLTAGDMFLAHSMILDNSWKLSKNQCLRFFIFLLTMSVSPSLNQAKFVPDIHKINHPHNITRINVTMLTRGGLDDLGILHRSLFYPPALLVCAGTEY